MSIWNNKFSIPLRPKRLAEDDGLDQAIRAVVVLFQIGKQAADQTFVLRLQGTSQGKGGEALGDVADEFIAVVLLDGFSQFSGAIDGDVTRQRAARIDRLAGFFVAEAADGVEVL